MKKSVLFKNAELKMAGELHLPAGFDESKKYAAVVCVHPGGGVKEQTAGLYAGKLAEMGYVAMAFDASHRDKAKANRADSNTRPDGSRMCAARWITS